MYQVLNKLVPVPAPVVQVPVPVVQVPNLQVPVQVVKIPVQVPVRDFQVPVQCIHYRNSVTLQLHKVKLVASFIFKKNECVGETPSVPSVGQCGTSDLLHFKYNYKI